MSFHFLGLSLHLTAVSGDSWVKWVKTADNDTLAHGQLASQWISVTVSVKFKIFRMVALETPCYKVTSIPGAGRGLVATRDIAQGDLILSDGAAVTGPCSRWTDKLSWEDNIFFPFKISSKLCCLPQTHLSISKQCVSKMCSASVQQELQ